MFHPQGPTFWELAQQALSSTERGYDLLAPKFDYTPFRTPQVILDALPPWIGPVDSAVDICCGTGAAMETLRPLVRERLVGIDISRGMLEVARQRLDQLPGSARLEFVRGDVLAMSLESPVDLAVCVGALGHILPQDEPDFVRAVAGVLRPGGRFVFVTSEMPSKLSASYWLARAFNGAMHLRNLLVRPPFVMYYLTFLLPRAQVLLEQSGFDVVVHEDVWSGRLRPLRLVIATRGDGSRDHS